MHSDRLHGKEREIVDETDFLLDKGFAVTDAGEQTVVARFGKRALANFFFASASHV